MIFRQLFDPTSCTYSYLLASRKGGEALIIDPVLAQEVLAKRGCAVTPGQFLEAIDAPDVTLVDLREDYERGHGEAPSTKRSKSPTSVSSRPSCPADRFTGMCPHPMPA